MCYSVFECVSTVYHLSLVLNLTHASCLLVSPKSLSTAYSAWSLVSHVDMATANIGFVLF